jgi:Fe2+ transport system protein FeoA
VSNPDWATRISGRGRGASGLRLAGASIGRTVRVTGISAEVRQALGREGVVTGARLTVERRVGLGGPVIVRLGRARLAIARAVAEEVQVEPGGES